MAFVNIASNCLDLTIIAIGRRSAMGIATVFRPERLIEFPDGFDPPNAEVPNLLNEKRRPIHSKPPRLDNFLEVYVKFCFMEISSRGKTVCRY